MKLKGKKVLVVGLGISGKAVVRFLLKEGASVVVSDHRLGPHTKEMFDGKDMIVVSPGVPWTIPGLREAQKKGIPIIGEFGLAAERLKVPMIAVTGTNGKSTTCTLIAKILEQAGKKVALAGNIGKPLLEVVMEGKKLDWVVAEVSSYQLETVGKFRPKISALLNITEDHLDRYDSLRDYARAKFRIFKEQGPRDFLIYYSEDALIRQGIRQSKARKIPFKGHGSFPRVKLVGQHNVENMMAATAVARCLKVPQPVIQRALEKFEGLPHRTQFVQKVQGVSYYDDSKGTNVDAVVKSLAGFPDGKVLLIAGGRDKGGSYRPLRKVVSKKVKHLLLIGEAQAKMAKALLGTTSIHREGTLQKAVKTAAAKSACGDVVLLSPACSSFDQFQDYKERGDLFQKLVKQI